MNSEFNWWLLIVGIVGGAGLLWLVLGDWSRREEEVGDVERARESAWIAESLQSEGTSIAPETAEEVLRLHRAWLRDTGGFDPLDEELDAAAPAPIAREGEHHAPTPPSHVRRSAGHAIRGEAVPED